MSPAPVQCRSFGHADDLSVVTSASEALPRREHLLAGSRGIQEGLLLHGESLFPGIRWFLVEDRRGPAALVPLQVVPERVIGATLMSARALSRFELLYADAQIRRDVDPHEMTRALLRSVDGGRTDVLRLRDLPATSALYELARGLTGGKTLSARPGTSLIPTGESGEVWLRSLSKNLRGQVRQAEKRLMAHGPIAIRLITAPESIEEGFERFLQLEAAGYKRDLNPLAREAGDREVFRAALRHHADTGEALVMELWVGGELAASQFGLQRGDRFYLIKVAFDERHAEASPGTFLMAELLRHFSDLDGVRFVDCCVRQRWHDRWHPVIEESFFTSVPNTGTLRGLLLGGMRRLRDAIR